MKGRVKGSVFRTAAQVIYLTAENFLRHNLISYASACAFGFLFSFIPVVILIFMLLSKLLNTSPEAVSAVFNFDQTLTAIPGLSRILDSLRTGATFGRFEIAVIITIFWMARRFFASIMDALYRIFRKAAPSRPFTTQIIIFGGEIVIVILLAAALFAFISIPAVTSLSVFSRLTELFPQLSALRTAAARFPSSLPYIFGVLLVAMTYRTGSGTRPPFRLCLYSAALCILSFWIAAHIMSMVLDQSTYDIIYGVLSRLIILLMEVFIFFILFLICAQFIFVVQFLDTMLLTQLYLLPQTEDHRLSARIKRGLFIRPGHLLRTPANTLKCSQGDVIYWPTDSDTNVYYIVSGSVQVRRHESVSLYTRGSFFGELSCVLSKNRDAQAEAVQDSLILCISGETFLQMLEQDSRVAAKALSQISAYFTRIYGRTDTFLL